MSKVKDRERAREFVYRNGEKQERSRWDKYQRELKGLAQEQRLKAIGMINSKPEILVATRKTIEEIKNVGRRKN